MRLQAVVLLLSMMLLLPYVAAADDPTRVDRVNKLLSNFSTPQLAPGESGTFSFDVVNTNENNMTNVSLTMSIYMFATAEESKIVDDSWSTPLIRNNQEQTFTFPPFDVNGTLAENNTSTVSVEIVTSVHTTRGGVFDQAREVLEPLRVPVHPGDDVLPDLAAAAPELASLVTFLMSEGAGYLTGQGIVSDGGWVKGTF